MLPPYGKDFASKKDHEYRQVIPDLIKLQINYENAEAALANRDNRTQHEQLCSNFSHCSQPNLY